MLPAQPNQSLIDGIACLQTLAVRTVPVGVREMARELGLETTRVSRLLGTLSHLGLAERTPARQYRAGPAMHVLSAQALKGSRLLQKAYPALVDLGRKNPTLTLALGVLWRDHVCYIYHGKPGAPFDPGIFHFDLYPAEKSTIGLTLMAHRPDSPPKGLAGRLREIRRAGFCEIDRGGGERGVAVPLGQPPVAALAFAGKFPASHLSKLIGLLQSAAHSIEEKL